VDGPLASEHNERQCLLREHCHSLLLGIEHQPERHPVAGVGPGLGGIPVRRVDGRKRHRPSDVVDVAVAIYGRIVVAQERRERGPGGVVQVADSVYPEEEVGAGYKRCNIACVISIGFVAFVRYRIFLYAISHLSHACAHAIKTY
jgi:hypothetical protein